MATTFFPTDARILYSRTKLQNTDVFTKMAKESSLYIERFKLVDEPQENYTINL
jgi:hypothetical protein